MDIYTRTDIHVKRQTDRCIGGRANESTEREMNKHLKVQRDVQTDGHIHKNRCTFKQVDRWMDGW